MVAPPPRLSELCALLRSRRGKVARDERGQPPHDDEAGRGIALKHAEGALAVDAKDARILEAARARDAVGIALEQRRPAEHLALLQHEAARRGALAAADQELHAPGIEHEEILGRVARAIERRALYVLLALGECRQVIQHDCIQTIEELAAVERRVFAGEV